MYIFHPSKITELKPWDTVHMYLIVPYSNSIRQHQPGGTIINNNVSFVCKMMIYPIMSWFEIVKVPKYDLYEVTGGNDEHINK